MEKQKITSKLKEKIPSYVPIYNRLYTDIATGVLADGTQLPSESDLTQKYSVSRNTLRQALTVLTEDGLISKRQGKGTVVTYRNNMKPLEGSNICNPMIRYAKEAVEGIDISFNFAAPTDVAQKKLAINANEIIMASNIVYLINNKPIGRTFIQIPAKQIEQINLDLNKEEDVSAMVNTTIYEIAKSASMNIRVIRAEGEIRKMLEVDLEAPLLFIEEILFNKEGEAIARCKFYLIPEHYELTLLL
jgi:GntR family transcriptional regulator